MKTKAAVAHAAGKPLVIETVDVEGPREGEAMVEVKATGICHTDAFTLSGADPEGLFPCILGHEGAGVVVEVGAGVTSVVPGDHVIPLYTPECRQCKSCLSGKTNLCTAIGTPQGRGLMPDETSRFSLGKNRLFHYMGTSTFSRHGKQSQGDDAAKHGAYGHQIEQGFGQGKNDKDQGIAQPVPALSNIIQL